jgi:hypothetical protein
MKQVTTQMAPQLLKINQIRVDNETSLRERKNGKRGVSRKTAQISTKTIKAV